MTTAVELIADLDANLAEAGETVTVRRYTAPTGSPRPEIHETAKATVRPLRAEELVGNIDQTWSMIITSPTSIASLLPIKKGDKVVVQGRERNVEFPRPIYVQDVLVRLELLVGG